MSNYIVTRTENGTDNPTTLVVFNSPTQGLLTAQNDNPQIEKIIDRLRSGDTANIETLFDVALAVAATFERLSERVTLRNGRVLFDGDAVDDAIESLILRAYRDGDAVYASLVNFMEKVYANTDAHTRENLFTWLRAENFSITTTGDIVAYKGLREDGTSIHAGPATVDGIDVNGYVPNKPGSTVEIRRSDVVADPARGCAYGLHAGTYNYANWFSQGLLVEVHINPRDVVSVPTDCEAQKMRVARYRVVQSLTAKHNSPVVASYEDDDWSVEDSEQETGGIKPCLSC